MSSSLHVGFLFLYTNSLLTLQAAVIGSILSKLCMFLSVDKGSSLISHTLVLILGMCFFAGGLRFSEQGFDQSKPNCRTTTIVTKHYVSCEPGSFFTIEHQRRCTTPSSSIPFCAQWCPRVKRCGSNQIYNENESWGECFTWLKQNLTQFFNRCPSSSSLVSSVCGSWTSFTQPSTQFTPVISCSSFGPINISTKIPSKRATDFLSKFPSILVLLQKDASSMGRL